MINDIPPSKRELGQYFTKRDVWLKDNVKKFILDSKCKIAYDPFAGSGDLLKVATELGFKETIGLDIDKTLGWEYNNSLIEIPKIADAIIITNPPYLSNYSAKRKKISGVEQYFCKTEYDNLYLLALENMLKAEKYVVALIPETFVNSPFPKSKLHSVNILEENPFDDTENPICIACFDGRVKPESEIMIYKNSHFHSSLGALEAKRLKPKKNQGIIFNCL